jgi:hypothetical protein
MRVISVGRIVVSLAVQAAIARQRDTAVMMTRILLSIFTSLSQPHHTRDFIQRQFNSK